VYIGQYQSARADNASDMLLPVLAAVMLGGVDIFGGRGNVVGLALSLLLIGTLKNGMGLANVSGPTQDFVTGLVLVVAVTPPPRQLVASLSRVRSASVDAQGSGDNDAEGASSPPDVFVRKSK
jgi:rhamnose transport system permease protein